ncbi:MAG: hypothetical protein ACOYLH_06630 [Flavobacteriales bacterium]
MKSIYFSIALVATVFLFSGCDKMKEKRFSTTAYYTFDVSATTDNNGSATIDLSGLIDILTENADLAKYADNIKRYELVAIKYKVFEYYNDPATTMNGSLGFGNRNSTAAGTEFGLNDISLQASMDNTEHVKLDFENAAVEKIQQYFLDTNGLKIYLNGLVSQTPVNFKLSVQCDIDAIAEVKK